MRESERDDDGIYQELSLNSVGQDRSGYVRIREKEGGGIAAGQPASGKPKSMTWSHREREMGRGKGKT